MKALSIVGGIALLLFIAGVLAYTVSDPNTGGPVSNTDDAAIRKVVMEFGLKMKEVSLLATTADREAAMMEHYGLYVTPELRLAWAPEGAEALGRYTSSPWPDSINIVE
ncbi:MAG: hypothetical protein AAB955_02050, partial [Patescibacteria group bacterium]